MFFAVDESQLSRLPKSSVGPLPVGLPASHGVFVLAGKVKCPAGDTDRPGSITFYLFLSADAASLCAYAETVELATGFDRQGEAKCFHTLARRTTLSASSMIHKVANALNLGIPQLIPSVSRLRSNGKLRPTPAEPKGLRHQGRSAESPSAAHPWIQTCIFQDQLASY